jgi:hypothetical protein
MANYVKKSERDVKAIARGHGRSMVKVLAGIATNADAQPSARVAAANSLLDRGFGKPEQHTSLDVTHDVTAFLRDLQGTVIDARAESLDTMPVIENTQKSAVSSGESD